MSKSDKIELLAPVIWRALVHHLRLCHKRRLGYCCRGRSIYRECG
jgi:hypothetical protein